MTVYAETRFDRSIGWLAALTPLGLLGLFVSRAVPIAAGQVDRIAIPWIAALDVSLSFRLDGLSLLFAILITLTGTLIAIYSHQYLAGHPQRTRFHLLLLGFTIAMLVLVTADNLILLFVGWELTSLASYFLIGFNHQRAPARLAAKQALIVTALGGMAFLVAALLIGQAVGSLELSTILDSPELVRNASTYPLIVILILVGAFTKSAQFPFHFWLPNAMEAPSPVSAFLHSATMVKAGIYLLARLDPVLGGSILWNRPLILIGAATMLLGAFLALWRTDLKAILAYSTISALGSMTLLIGMNAPVALLVILLAHALYKAALFLMTGIVERATGTRDIDRLSGLGRLMPWTASAAILAAASLAGAGPFLGFIGKEAMLATVFDHPGILMVVAASSVMLVAIALVVGVRPFFGEASLAREPADPPASLWLAPFFLASMGLVLAFVPAWTGRFLISPAAAAITGESSRAHLSLWHGFSRELALSTIIVALGIALFAALPRIRLSAHRATREGTLQRRFPSAENVYDGALNVVAGLARVQTNFLQNGYLRYYLLTILLTVTTVAGWTLATRTAFPFAFREIAAGGVRFHEITIVVAIFAGALGAVMSSSRLGAITSLGVVGYGVALIFLIFGAPDLAMTQFLVETLTVVLFVLVLYRLPRFAKISSTAARARDIVSATFAGVLVTALVLAVAVEAPVPEASRYYIQQAVPAAHGRNVVNVILVDFRALDTLGEITVISIAAAGVYALLRLRGERSS